jgi:membrane-associated protease RseP (regulator of RpoE activity)
MLNERFDIPDYRIPPGYLREMASEDDATQARRIRLDELVRQHMLVDRSYVPDPDELALEDRALLARGGMALLVSYAGEMQSTDTATAFDALDAACRPLDLTPLLRHTTAEDASGRLVERHWLLIAEGRFAETQPTRYWINIALFVATVFSVLLTGAIFAVNEMGLADTIYTMEELLPVLVANIWRGWPYAVSLLAILLVHEFGHYLMMRRHGVASTYPYFLPLPIISPFGTLGAAILLKGPVRTRRHLLDIGAAGPLAGMAVALPVLLLGLATSEVSSVSTGLVEGNSLLYALAKLVMYGQVLPAGGRDVILNQVAWAGWTGLFVTALNLIPIGQLDGGHVLYAVLGEGARRLYWPLIALVAALTVLVSSAWLVLILMLLIFGRVYAVPLNNVTGLDRPRLWIGLLAFATLVAVFVPVPLSDSAGMGDGLLGAMPSLPLYGMMAIALCWGLRARLRR